MVVGCCYNFKVKMGAHLEERLKALLPLSGREDVAVAKEEEHFIPQRLEPLN